MFFNASHQDTTVFSKMTEPENEVGNLVKDFMYINTRSPHSQNVILLIWPNSPFQGLFESNQLFHTLVRNNIRPKIQFTAWLTFSYYGFYISLRVKDG